MPFANGQPSSPYNSEQQRRDRGQHAATAEDVTIQTNKDDRDKSQAEILTEKKHNRYIIESSQTAESLLLPDLFRKIYGDHYLAGEVYDPAHYIRANESSEAISIVARGPDSMPVGHVALVTSAPHRGV